MELDSSNGSMVDIIMIQDDASWGLGSFDEDMSLDNLGYKGEALAKFKAHVANVRDNMVPFDKDEIAVIELMDILRRKKATLDTYPSIWEWHTAKMPPGHKPPFISRKKIINKLTKRYNFPTKTVVKHGKERKEIELVKKKPIILPSSGAKVDIIYHDARDQVVSLLTDPRFGDEDFLHFNDNPLAPLLHLIPVYWAFAQKNGQTKPW